MTSTPILVGIAQLEQRIDDPLTGKEPLALMEQALRAAAEDAGSPALLSEATSVRVIRGIWPYKNPAAVLAEGLGLAGAESCLTPFGGNFVQTTLNMSALDIQAGRHDVILITGAECGNTQAKVRRAGLNAREDLSWQEAAGEPDRLIGEDHPMSHPLETELGIRAPIQVYPMFETALRHHLGRGVEEHQQAISELWAGFSAVAADNPHAWLREPRSAEEIRTLSAQNRPVSFPYPKLMNSNSNVDQGAALILTSVAKARSLGIPEDRWVYPWVGTDAHDHYYVSNRDNFYSSPAIRFAGGRALELAGLTPDDLDFVDVYSCFPSAVQVAARELGLDMAKPLTVTGGLTFAGGPLNNYVMHSIARSAELLRAQPGSRALVTANGGYLTKHAFGIYSTEPPATPYQHADLQAEVDATPKREVVGGVHAEGSVEAYTVMYDAEGPSVAHLAALLPDGRRTWAHCRDAAVLDAMTREEYCGRPVTVADNDAQF